MKKNKEVLKHLEHASHLTKEEIRSFIDVLEEIILDHTQVFGHEFEAPISHHFSKDVYGREMKLKAGEMIVGKIHKHQNLNILSEGECSVLSVDGIKRLKAPHTFVASPGAKRVILAHTDVTWTTIHGTAEKDLKKIEDEFIAKSYDEVVHLTTEDKKCLGS